MRRGAARGMAWLSGLHVDLSDRMMTEDVLLNPRNWQGWKPGNCLIWERFEEFTVLSL